MAEDRSTLRIRKEVQEINKGSDLSLAVWCHDSNVRNVKTLIIGPPGTPYEFGFFDFYFHFGSNYPTTSPKVTAVTTNAGRTRFNPNIYASGKVCLSILGTWRGEPGENWSSAQGLESVLLSIQSLMSSNPYENEPGYDKVRAKHEKDKAEAYIAKIKHETIRISIIQRLEEYVGLALKSSQASAPASPWDSDGDGSRSPPSPDVDESTAEPFVDLCKRRFLWHFALYLNTIESESQKHKDGTPFVIMPFEHGGNQMNGAFEYAGLKNRLLAIKEQLTTETADWAVQGLKYLEEDRGHAVTLQRKFTQIRENNRACVFNLELELVDENPFVWKIILYGKPMTKLEGGIFYITIHISPKFPDEQPRVTVNTPIFHHRVAVDGTLCYFVDKPEDIASHVVGAIDALESESVPYDPRTMVNPEASRLFWGSAEDKKQYNRKLRRSVEASTEF